MTNEDSTAVIYQTESPEETEYLGEQIGALLGARDIVCLAGNLGAGKTCLVRGMARGWGASGQATSPTFTLINEYRRTDDNKRFYHMDSYRLSGTADALSTGLDDILDAQEILVIEWPEHILDTLPADRLWIEITDQGGDSRKLAFTAGGSRAAVLLSRLGEIFPVAAHD
ncbi:MAG: tRNA (adenosine(37)-N6)-threonylcarbamoyltransferase complex ATPase subunit type 1 TsaE [Anaerolineae bacterium]|nr:tRNA (adenosine(37)-N6)-threonylcarbamoyltransferase complex ATPase subunit type 1 TsaE [Anaerolineae bacterium]